MLIKGIDLNLVQVKQVKAAFVHRRTKDTIIEWTIPYTIENGYLYRGYDGGGQTTNTLNSTDWKKLPTDQDWINDHAFYFIKDGSRLNWNYECCEPACMAD